MGRIVRCPGCFVHRNQWHKDDCDLVKLIPDKVHRVEGRAAWVGSYTEALAWNKALSESGGSAQ